MKNFFTTIFSFIKKVFTLLFIFIKRLFKLILKLFWPINFRKIIIWLLVFSFAWNIYSFYSKKNKKAPENNPIIIDVMSWTILNSIQTFWKSSLTYEQKLKFSQTWKVKKINVAVWDSVKEWQILLELEDNVAQAEINQVKIKVDNAQSNLNKIINEKNVYWYLKLKSDRDTFALKIKQLENELKIFNQNSLNQKDEKSSEINEAIERVNELKNNSSLNKQKLEKEVVSIMKNLKENKEKLENLNTFYKRDITKINNDKDNKIISYHQDLKNRYIEIENSIKSIDDNLESINEILDVDSSYYVDNKNSLYFSAKNSTYKSNAWTYYYSVKDKQNKIKNYLNWIDLNEITINQLKELYELQSWMYYELSKLASNMQDWYTNSIDTVDFTKSEIDSWKSSMWGLYLSSINSYTTAKNNAIKIDTIDSIEDINRKYNDDLKAKNDEIEKLKNTIEIQENEYEIANTSLNWKKQDIDNAIKKALNEIENKKFEFIKIDDSNALAYQNKLVELQSAKIELQKLDEKISSKQDDEIILAENTLKDAILDLEQKEKKLDEYKIIAPFDGKVSALDFKIGDNIDSNSTSYIYLVNPNLIEITINLDQIDIVKVNKWQVANITFDAFPEYSYTWTLWDINWQVDTNTMNYPVKVTFTKKDKDIYSWMSAQVSIELEKKDNIIVIPASAIETDQKTGEKFVTKYNSWVKKKVIIETWMIWDGQVEIISWLSVWDKIFEINFDTNDFKPEQYNWGMWSATPM